MINNIKMKLIFQSIFDNPLSKFHSKWIGYVPGYLPKLWYVQWVTNSTPDLEILGSKSVEVLDLV